MVPTWRLPSDCSACRRSRSPITIGQICGRRCDRSPQRAAARRAAGAAAAVAAAAVVAVVAAAAAAAAAVGNMDYRSLTSQVGIGWRPELALVIERAPETAFIEVVAENISPDEIPRPLLKLKERGAIIVPHGTA